MDAVYTIIGYMEELMTNTKTLCKILVASLLVPALAISATAAAPKKASKKPAPKRVVQGTKQWSGENADLNKTYTIGKESPINFSLNSAEYSVMPLGFGGEDPFTLTAKSNEKLLLVHFTLHNPRPQETRVLWATVHFTAVDDKNANHEDCEVIGTEKDKTKLWMDLKPGQKVDCYSAVVIPADCRVAKLIVTGDKPEEGVLRFYKEKLNIKPLEARYADPQDSTRARALEQVPAQTGTYLPLKVMLVRIDSVAYSSDQLDDESELPEDSRYLVCTITVKNSTPEAQSFGWGELDGSKVVTDQDEEVDTFLFLLQKSNRKAEYADLKPGQEKTVRVAFIIPSGSNAKTLVLRQGEESRSIALDVSNID